MPHTTKQYRFALLAALAGNAIWGFSFLFTRTALKVTAVPAVLLSMRFGIAFLIMTGMILLGKGSFRLKGKKVAPLLFLGIVEPVCFLLETYGILYTNATVAGVVMALCEYITKKLHQEWLESFSMALSMLVGMSAAVLLGLL